MGVILRVPVRSMYGIFTYIYHKNQLNVGKYTIPWEPTVPLFRGYNYNPYFGGFKNFILPSVSGVQGYIDPMRFGEVSRWWFQILFDFHPYLGKISNFD